MTPDSDQHPLASRRKLWLRYALAVIGLGLVLWLASRAIDTGALWQLLLTANPGWLAAAVGLKFLTPLCTAALYARVLRLLGHPVRALSLWLTAQIAIFVNMAFPAGPVAMSAFLMHVFRRRRVPEGVTTLAVALDTLTYEIGFFSLVAFGLGYLFTHGDLSVRQITEVALIAFAVVLGGMYLWGLQRDRADLTHKVIGLQQWLSRRFRRNWQPTGVVHFLDELYRGKALIAQRPGEFMHLLGLQVGVLTLDVLTLYCAFRTVGNDPHLSVVVLSYSLASLFATLAPLPGGGGSFEATVVLTASRLGVPTEVALGATLIYRVLAFWLPAVLTALTYRAVVVGTPLHPERQR